VQNSTNAIGMLKLGRVEVFADYYLDLSLNLPPEELASLNYDPTSPIASVKDHILCHSTPKNIRFINQVNKVIHDMKQDGRLKTILGNYYGYKD
jgi:ABC-type amino acid transport substrate-binding protein